MRTRRQDAAILRACVLGDDAALRPLVPGVPPDGLVDLAVEHRVAPLTFARLRALDGVDPDLLRLLGAAWLENRMAAARISADVAYLVELLAPLAIPWIVVKGPAVAALLYEPPETRSAGDLDVLVAPDDFARVVDALEAAGHEVDDANWELVRRRLAGQLHLWLPGGTSLDLHWSLLYDRADRARFPVATEELLERRRPLTASGAHIATLGEVDTLVHLCLHAAADGGDRLSWLCDIHRAWANPETTIPSVIARCREWHVELAVGTMLLRTRIELGTPVPNVLLDELVPSWWRLAISGLARSSPVARSTRRWGDPVSLLTRSATRATTAPAALGEACTGLRRRSGRFVTARSAERIGRRRPDDIHLERGGADERRAYFRELATMARPR